MAAIVGYLTAFYLDKEIIAHLELVLWVVVKLKGQNGCSMMLY